MATGWVRIFVVLTAMLAMVVSGVGAEPMGKKTRAAAQRFAANYSLFVLYHEVAHLLIDQLDFPVLGREEDAADNMATWTMLNAGTPESHEALADAAYGWLLSGIAYGSGIINGDYGAHTPDQQRSYQIVCLMVGSDDRAFRNLANEYALERERQDSCFWDYKLIDRSMRTIIDSHVDKKVQSGGVEVTYHDVSGRLRTAADAFRKSGVFDRVAAEVERQYPLRRRVAFNAKRCGEPNAFYDPMTVEIIFCYELMDELIALAAKDMKLKGGLHPGPDLGFSRRNQ